MQILKMLVIFAGCIAGLTILGFIGFYLGCLTRYYTEASWRNRRND